MAERRSPAPKKRAASKKPAPAGSTRQRATSAGASASPPEEVKSIKETIADAVGAVESCAVAVESAATTGDSVAVQNLITNDASAATTPPAEKTDHSGNHSTGIEARVLDVFLIDSGWNTPVCAAVHENVPAVAAYLKGHRFFVLNQQQSLTYVKRHPSLVGADPILLVVDRKSSGSNGGCGFRLCLGHVRQPEVAVSMLKWAMQLTMTASSAEMVTVIRKSAHRETLQGAIELIGEGSTHLLEFDPV